MINALFYIVTYQKFLVLFEKTLINEPPTTNFIKYGKLFRL